MSTTPAQRHQPGPQLGHCGLAHGEAGRVGEQRPAGAAAARHACHQAFRQTAKQLESRAHLWRHLDRRCFQVVAAGLQPRGETQQASDAPAWAPASRSCQSSEEL